MHAMEEATSVSACRLLAQKFGVAALLVGSLTLAGCTVTPPAAPDAPKVIFDAGGVPIPPPHTGPPRLLKTSELSDAEKKFGISPEQAPGLTYQPDVVMLRSGVNAIKSLSEDGLVWTLDPRAEGIDTIQPGKVLLLSTKAAGRVLGVNRTSAGVEVVLGPADITEIVREGDFSIDQPLDLTDTLQMALPSAFDPPRPVDPIVASVFRSDTEGFIISPVRFLQQPAAEHDFRVIPMASVKGVGAELRSKPGGVLMVAQFLFKLEQPNLDVKLKIEPTGVKHALVELQGAAGLEASFEAAAPGPNARNINADRPASVDLFIPINFGVPLAIHVRQAFRVQTAFASTGTVKAHGVYAMSGGIGAEYTRGADGKGKFSVNGPSGFGTKEALLANMDGAAFGPVGIVFVHQVNVMVGLGVAGFVAGPYVYDNNAVTAAKGSALSRPLTPECRRETVTMAVGAGVGWRIPSIVAKVINDILKVFKITAEIKDSGGVQTDPVRLVDTGWYWPKMQACGS